MYLFALAIGLCLLAFGAIVLVSFFHCSSLFVKCSDDSDSDESDDGADE